MAAVGVWMADRLEGDIEGCEFLCQMRSNCLLCFLRNLPVLVSESSSKRLLNLLECDGEMDFKL